MAIKTECIRMSRWIFCVVLNSPIAYEVTTVWCYINLINVVIIIIAQEMLIFFAPDKPLV